jgi:hypothetical protein
MTESMVGDTAVHIVDIMVCQDFSAIRFGVALALACNKQTSMQI